MRLSTFSEPQILELVSFFVLPQACKLLELGEFEIAANKCGHYECELVR